MIKACIVGSGPSGISAAQALLGKGIRVLMIDAGKTISPIKVAQQQQASKLKFIWKDSNLVRSLYSIEKNYKPPHPSGKLLFGSNYYYDTDDIDSNHFNNGCMIYPSLAYGGYSNVWGGAILPYRMADLEGWPLTLGDLEDHYRAIHKFMPISAVVDSLTDEYPLYSAKLKFFKSSPQAINLLNVMNSKRELLNRSGIQFGKSRLAVNPDTAENDCIYCGQCLNGCPRNLIYNSKDTVETLKNNPLFSYLGGVKLEKYEEINGYVSLYIKNIKDSTQEIIQANKVFLGCGVVNTAMIVLKSQLSFKNSIKIKDSQYFLLPGIINKSSRETNNNNLHTLSQIFLEIDLPKKNWKRSHLQIYTYNDLYENYLEKKMGPLFKVTRNYVHRFIDRLVMIQGYLHSDYSSEIHITLNENNKILLTNKINSDSKQITFETMRYLFKNRDKIGFTPIYRFINKIGSPGESSHLGSTFPMSVNAEKNTTDRLGRLSGSLNIHIIDASVLPSISSGPITFTVMANAHRIASESIF